jgi:hypothetical protein
MKDGKYPPETDSPSTAAGNSLPSPDPVDTPYRNLEHVDRILAKAHAGDSYTADYAIAGFDSFFHSVVASHARPDDLGSLIVEIVRDDPEISWKDLLKELERRAGQGVIESITEDDFIQWRTSDGTTEKTPISGLKDRLTRARDSLKRNSR